MSAGVLLRPPRSLRVPSRFVSGFRWGTGVATLYKYALYTLWTDNRIDLDPRAQFSSAYCMCVSFKQRVTFKPHSVHILYSVKTEKPAYSLD